MKRVMMISAFADCAPDLRRWTVKVTDERRRPVFTVLFPAYFAPRGWKPVLVSGARTLLMRLDAMNAVDDKSQGRKPSTTSGCVQGASTNSGRRLSPPPGGGEGTMVSPPRLLCQNGLGLQVGGVEVHPERARTGWRCPSGTISCWPVSGLS
jgi:hypothetical protein